ncbi:MAG: cytochrome B [Saprospiraceae bacterium]|nr:cytochrome B [Saprospiraceae bacterium]
MLNGLLHAHSGLRWVVLALLIAATFMALLKWRSNATYTDGSRKLNLFTMISMHVQLLLGLALFFMSDKVDFSQMKEAMYRFFSVEHSVMMLLAIALVTIGHSKSKKATEDARKFRTIFIFYGLALLLVLVAIPWPFRGWGNGWF